MSFQYIKDIVSLIADSMSIIASAIAIWIFIKEKDKILSLINTFKAFYFHNTLATLEKKVEELNNFDYSDTNQTQEIESIFHEIIGQIRGNNFLNNNFQDELNSIVELTDNNFQNFTNPQKRGIVANIRSKIEELKTNNQSKLY